MNIFENGTKGSHRPLRKLVGPPKSFSYVLRVPVRFQYRESRYLKYFQDRFQRTIHLFTHLRSLFLSEGKCLAYFC